MYDDFTLVMIRGDSRTFTIQTRKPDNTGPQDITGWDLWFTGKIRLRDLDVDAVFQKTAQLGGGITVINGPLGTARVKLDPPDTADLTSQVTELLCDVQGRDLAGEKVTLATGKLLVYADVTRA